MHSLDGACTAATVLIANSHGHSHGATQSKPLQKLMHVATQDAEYDIQCLSQQNQPGPGMTAGMS
jgi:hypothetical protein